MFVPLISKRTFTSFDIPLEAGDLMTRPVSVVELCGEKCSDFASPPPDAYYSDDTRYRKALFTSTNVACDTDIDA